MSINYTASPLNSNETLLEQLLKIRKYLEKNPIYKVYLYLGEYDTNLGIYDSNLVHIGEGDELSKNDVVLFTNDYYAVVDSVDKETSTFTIINAYYFGANGTGTKIYINGVYSDRQDLTDDIQNQINYLEEVDNQLKESIGRNVDGIARLGTDKQDKLAQQDLDNIAMLNQLPDKLNAKATKTEVNSLSMLPSDTIDNKVIPNCSSWNNNKFVFRAPSNGYLKVAFERQAQDVLFTTDMNGFISRNFVTAVFYEFNNVYEMKKDDIILFEVSSKTPTSRFSQFIHAKEI